MKVLNLYAGIGGNRKLWTNVEVTAVESCCRVAKAYARFFPQDNVVVRDAKHYLREQYQAFDFIWASPPCQSHSRMRQFMNVRRGVSEALYADMTLYQLILFLQANYRGMWVVENVKPYYNPLIKPSFVLGRHYFWSNIHVPYKAFAPEGVIGHTNIKNTLASRYNINLDALEGIDKRLALKNCVSPEIGRYILACVKKAMTGSPYAVDVAHPVYAQASFLGSQGEVLQ